jgi:hypothetical protein
MKVVQQFCQSKEVRDRECRRAVLPKYSPAKGSVWRIEIDKSVGARLAAYYIVEVSTVNAYALQRG